MMVRARVIILSVLMCCGAGFALEPDQILVIANNDVAASLQIAQYYRAKRNVPEDNILVLPLGTGLRETISRDNYEKRFAGPIRKKLSTLGFAGKIRCLLTTYGVPIKVGGRGLLKGQEEKLRQVKKLGDQMASVTKEQAEELREYVMKEYGLVMGHLETLVGVKSVPEGCPWIGKFQSPEFYYWLYNGASAKGTKHD